MTSPLDLLVSTRVAADVAALVFLRGSLVVAAAALAAWALRRRSAALRHAVWTASLASLVLLPLGALLPTWGSPRLTYPAETAWLGVEAIETGARALPAVAGRDAVAHTGAPRAPVPRSTARSDAARDGVRLWSALLLTWWLGALVLTVRTVVGAVGGTGRRRDARVLGPEHPAAALLERERTRMGIARPVRLLVGVRPGVAYTTGTLRPVVVIGPDVARLAAVRLHPVLLHELAHVRRWDHATHLVTALALALHWPNPLVWLARRRAALERERACDDEVVAGGVRSADYARVLLDFAVSRSALGPALRGAVGFFSTSRARRRIDSVLDARRSRRPLRTATSAVVGGAALALTVPLGSAGLWAHLPGTGPTPALERALESPRAEVRARAARTLGRRGSGSRPALEALLHDPAAEVRLAAVSALEQRAEAASIPAMVAVLERPYRDGGEHGFVLKLAMRHLAATDRAEAAVALEAQLARRTPQLRMLALELLASMPSHGARARPHLARFAALDADPRNRAAAARLLAR